MNGKRIVQLFLYIFLIKVNCDSKEKAHSKKFIPYFRQQVEETEDKKIAERIEKDDPHSNLVSFLVKNVREIFNDVIENPEIRPTKGITVKQTNQTTTAITNNSLTHYSMLFRPTVTVALSTTTINTTTTEAPITSKSSISSNPTDVMLCKNLTLTTLLDDKHAMTGFYEKNTRDNQLSKDLKYVSKADKKERAIDVLARDSPNPNVAANSSDLDGEHDPRKSCIMCNNVASEDCNDPQNKLIQSIMCERDDDTCYSMHTPFGIIDRGCYNKNHNLTIYICSCNLCNDIALSEMPYVFTTQRDWVENVIELSRTRHFRKSIFRDMSCLRCEVNTTRQKGDVVDSANCLEGNIGALPVEDCNQNEVCAVKSVRADGYIWRGCIRAPLYNYWIRLCDHDLCNYDTIISIYDYV